MQVRVPRSIPLVCCLTFSITREFDPAWRAVAQAWSTVSGPERDNHFFATLDFDDVQTIFVKVSPAADIFGKQLKSMQLGLSSAPVAHVFFATEGPRASAKKDPLKYDMSQCVP
jgi:oligosaccharyltransferase complex subunit gamma